MNYSISVIMKKNKYFCNKRENFNSYRNNNNSLIIIIELLIPAQFYKIKATNILCFIVYLLLLFLPTFNLLFISSIKNY